MKRVLYFILSIAVIAYIGLMIYVVTIPNFAALGQWGTALKYISQYGGVALLFAFAVVNFTGNIFKIICLIALILITIFYIIVVAMPDTFARLLGVVAEIGIFK